MKKRILILLLILLLPFMVNAKSRFLYDTFVDGVEEDYAREYTEPHHDSFTEEPTEKVYYWRGFNNSAEEAKVLNKYNVIFGGFCWQTLRTTDTGGVKMIYNGIPTDGKCTSTGEASTIGQSKFNNKTYSFDGLGYMYKQGYEFKNVVDAEYVLKKTTLSTRVYYADTYSGVPLSYNLVNPIQIESTTDYSALVGKFSFFSSTQINYYGSVNYIVAVNGKDVYYVVVSDNSDYLSYNDTYTYGTSYTDNGDGTFTINNPTSFNRFDFYSNYQNLSQKYVCINGENATCNNLRYIKSSGDQSYYYLKVYENYKYANSFTFDEETGLYTLNNNSINLWNYSDEYNSLKDKHYTCFNNDGVCSTLYYVYYLQYGRKFYLELNNGMSIEDALNDMLHGDDVNQNDSIIKAKIDAWYENNLIDYSEYLEDTIFCNNRNMSNASTNGFNPNGGNMTVLPKLNDYVSGRGTVCANETDKFSINNSKAKLKYPIGLPSYYDLNSLSNNMRKNGVDYWTASNGGTTIFTSPIINQIVYLQTINAAGSVAGSCSVDHTNVYVRPMISLKPKTRYISGEGSKDNPYVIDYNEYYSVNVEIKNETEELNVEIEDMTTVAEGEDVTFKVTPIKGYQVNNIEIIDENNNGVIYEETDNKNEYTFVMPSSNVTIIPSYEKVTNAIEVEDNKNTKEITIEVNDVKAVVYEETVKFTVIPEEGYEVDTIIITDEEGNNISYKKTKKENEYEFTMPDTDVLIKPVYKKIEVPNNTSDNPKTGKSYLFVFFILILGLVTILKHKKRLN